LNIKRPGRGTAILLLFVFVISLLGCRSDNRESYLFFKDDTGESLMTDRDLETLKVMPLLDAGGSRGLYIVPKDKNKVEEITNKTLDKSINIYYKNEFIFSQKIKHITKGINLVFIMDEESLKRLELLLKDN